MWITRISIRNPVFTTMVMAALLVLGIVSYRLLPVERMPDVASPLIFVQVSYPGASPEAVESELVKPLEKEINGVNGVKHIFSTTLEGAGYMQVEFRLDADIANGMQEIRDKVAAVKPSLPKEAKDPLIVRADLSGATQPVVSLALQSTTRSLRELGSLADQIVVKRLQTVPGASKVWAAGGATRQVRLLLDAEQLKSKGVGVDQVINAVQAANQDYPVGKLINGETQRLVRVESKIKEPADFGGIFIPQTSTPLSASHAPAQVRLGQLAQVVDGVADMTSIARLNGAPAVNVFVYPAQGANIVKLGADVKAVAEVLKTVLPADVTLTLTQSNSDDIERALGQTKETILEGALLTVIIVFMFLHSWRSTVITALTLPISVITTFIVVHAFGFSLNSLTLMALSLSIGLLIDDAIVVRENIVRHLGMGKSHRQAALDGTEEIGLAVLATTFAIVAVFVPIAFMHGVIGRLFYQFGITVATAVLVSLFVSFTLDPMLSSVWHDAPHAGPAWFVRAQDWIEARIARLHVGYDRILQWALNHRPIVVMVSFGLFGASFFLVPLVGNEFQPEIDDGAISLTVNTPIGSSLAYTDMKARQIEALLRQFKSVAQVQTTVGLDDGQNYAQLDLKLVDRHRVVRPSKDEVEGALREAIATVAGVELSVGNNKPIVVSILGPDPVKLTALSHELMQKMASVPGLVDLESSEKAANPMLAIRIDNAAANDLGLTPQQIGAALRPLLSGDMISHWQAADGQDYDVTVQLPQDKRRIAANLADLSIASSKVQQDGTAVLVPLHQVGSFVDSSSAQQLKRLDLERRISLYANVSGRPSGTVSAEVQALMHTTPLPPGYHFATSSQQADLQEAHEAFYASLALAIAFIYFVLASQFGNFLQPLVIMASLPLSLTGVLLALLVTHSTINVFSMIGFVMLMGLVVKNAILLVDFANLRMTEGCTPTQALLEAGRIRLRPILMTTLAMLFGMLPMATGLGEGSELQAPMGRAVIGGVLTSTLFTLVVVPVLYAYLEEWAGRVKARRQQRAALAHTTAFNSP